MAKDIKRMQLFFSKRVEPLKKLNDEFTLVRIYAVAPGKNRNYSYMSREDIENAIPSAYYCPVIGHIRKYTDEDGNVHTYMGSHDIEITENWDFIDATVPYGVIVENSEEWIEQEEHGVKLDYLTFQAVLWTGRYPELEKCMYSEDILFNQSVEINIDNYRPLEEDSNYMELLGFSFSGFCLLGKADEDSTNGHTDKDREHSEPAFISARVVPFEYDEFKKEFAELKEKIAFCLKDSPSTEVEDKFTKGGTAEVAKTETKVEAVETPIEDMELDTQPDVEVEEAEVPAVEEFETEETETEETTEETPAEDVTADEEPEAETESYSAEEYDELNSKYEALVAEHEAYKAEHSHTNADFDSLQQYHDSVEAEKREAAENALFAKFDKKFGENADEVKEYKAIKENKADYSISDLEGELYKIYGRYVDMAEATKETTETKKFESLKFSYEGIDTDAMKDNDPYGGAREFYL